MRYCIVMKINVLVPGLVGIDKNSQGQWLDKYVNVSVSYINAIQR